MPSPNQGEKRNDFIYRCMSSKESIETFSDSRSRASFCYSQWDRSVKGQKPERIGRLGRNVHKAKKPTQAIRKPKRRR